MSITTGRPAPAGAAQLLDHPRQRTERTARADLPARWAGGQAGPGEHGVRIAVVGAPGQGTSTLVEALAAAGAGELAGVRFHPTASPGADADAVLLVRDAGAPFDRFELDVVAGLRAAGRPVVGVTSKIDAYPQWADVQRHSRRQLQAAGLDNPSVPLLPVSAAAYQRARQRGDEPGMVGSGVPQLIQFLAEQVVAPIRPTAATTAITATRATTAVGATTQLTVPRARRPAEAASPGRAPVSWQVQLGDGATDLMAQVEHDLRHRLREIMHQAENQIMESDPVRRWAELDAWLRAQITESVRVNAELARRGFRGLAERLAALAAETTNTSADRTTALVAPPELPPHDPEEVVGQLRPLAPLPSRKASLGQRIISSLRGSYGGVLMVGVLTSLAGMALVNYWSVAAGVLLGAHTFWEDRKTRIERRQAEAKVAVSKQLDEAIFQVGEYTRGRLREMHRALRDHFTAVAEVR